MSRAARRRPPPVAGLRPKVHGSRGGKPYRSRGGLRAVAAASVVPGGTRFSVVPGYWAGLSRDRPGTTANRHSSLSCRRPRLRQWGAKRRAPACRRAWTALSHAPRTAQQARGPPDELRREITIGIPRQHL